MKYSRKMVTGANLAAFYENLFVGTSTNYGFLSYPHTFCPIPNKELILPLPFMEILSTKPMQMANSKIQTAHCYKIHPRMEDTRLDHMVFAQSLGVDFLSILEKKGYTIDNKTKVAFLIFLLIHDIGHGPFSHPFEQMVDGYKGMHEDIGKRTLQEWDELHTALESIYPGLTERLIHFKEYDEYGLNSLLEGVFDLDRAAFLIMDTFLMDGEEKSDAFYDIVDSVYKIFDSIILRNGKVYYDYKCFREMDDFLRIRKENYEEYQSPKRVLDDLILRRIGEEAETVVSNKQILFKSLPITIQEEIARFLLFIRHMKKEKSNVNLREYYSFGDYHFERVFQLLLLLDDPNLTRDCILILSSFEDYDKYYDIAVNSEKSGREDFYVDNRFTIYKSKKDENITFLKGEEEIDYKDCTGRLVEGETFLETISYTLKEPARLSLEGELRESLLQEINEELRNSSYQLEYLVVRFPSDEPVIEAIKNYAKSVKANISFEEHARLYGLTKNQLLAYLTLYTSNSLVRKNAMMLLSEHLGYYFTEEEASIRLKNKQYKITE